MESDSFKIAKSFLGREVNIIIDRPLGSTHPKHEFIYEVNYGYVNGTIAPDGEELDAYVLGIDHPVGQFVGKCIAIAHRENDDDDKLIVVPNGKDFSEEEILKQINFQEKWFKTIIVR